MRGPGADVAPGAGSGYPFTVIELLAVVTIIAILATLLLPALATGKAKARIAACASQQRQIYMHIATYATDHDNCTPYASRVVNLEAFGGGTQTLGFGLLTWSGYCSSQQILACPATNYHRLSGQQLADAATLAEGYGWGNFRRPEVLPMRGVQNFLYGDADGNSIYKSYGSATSYSYRRGDLLGGGGGDVYGGYPYHSVNRVPMYELPAAFLACAQQWYSGDFSHWTFATRENFTHDREGANVTYRAGNVKWLSLTRQHVTFALNPPSAAGCPDFFLPYYYHCDYLYAGPAMGFWGAATQNQ